LTECFVECKLNVNFAQFEPIVNVT
jgi:hypothetical protein